MGKFKTLLFLSVFLIVGIFGGHTFALADQSKVVLVGGGQVYKPLDDFMLDAEILGKGTNYYVDDNVTASGDGKSWDYAFLTITEAVAAVSAFDKIFVAPGDYDESAAVAITTEGIKIIGSGDDVRNVAMIWSTTGTYDLMTIDAHHVEIIGMSFSVIPDTKSAIVVSGTTTSSKVRIANCRFDGWSGEYGVYVNESPDIVIENNLFRSFNTSAIYSNSTRAMIRNNIIHAVAAKIGITHVPTGGNRPDTVIKDNLIKGVNSTDTGISLSGTPTESALVIEGNKVINCATPITLSKYTSWYEGNYWGREDWRYHPRWGEDAAAARGAVGNIFYVDLNMATTGLDGRSWASAFSLIATAITAADSDVGSNRNWAKRNTIYISGDIFPETLTVMPEKTDIVGIGYDQNARPRITKTMAMSPAVQGLRFFNIEFNAHTAAPAVSAVANMHGLEFHNCVFKFSTQAIGATHGLSVTAGMKSMVVKDSFFLANPDTIRFQTAAFAIAGAAETSDILFENTYIEGKVGVFVNSNIVGLGSIVFRNCDIKATTLAVDDNVGHTMWFGSNFMSDAASGGAGAPNVIDHANKISMMSGCYLASADSNGHFPPEDAHD